jgi:hypothetical protein
MNRLLVGPTLAFSNNSNLLTSSLTSHMTQLTTTDHALKGLLIALVVANSCVTILVLHHISLFKKKSTVSLILVKKQLLASCKG